jgi:ribosomal protein L17
MANGLTWESVQECYRRAKEARRLVDTATTAAEKADLVGVEQRWLSLARELLDTKSAA